MSNSLSPVLVETNYWLVERSSNSVSVLWIGFQVIFLAIAGTSGIVCSYCFSVLKIQLQDNCILYSKLVFYPPTTPNDNRTYQINLLLSDWGKEQCNFILYEPIVTSIVAFVFITLSIVCGRGGVGQGTGLPQPWRIVMPLLFANFVCASVSWATGITFNNGINEFCQNLKPYRRNVTISWCDPIKELYIGNQNVGADLLSYLDTNQISLWVNFMFWCLSFCWIIMRCFCVVDFRLVRTQIFDYSGTADDLINEEFLFKNEDFESAHSFVLELEPDQEETVTNPT